MLTAPDDNLVISSWRATRDLIAIYELNRLERGIRPATLICQGGDYRCTHRTILEG